MFKQRTNDVLKDYNLIAKEIPDFKDYTLKEFKDMRCAVGSRNYTVKIAGH